MNNCFSVWNVFRLSIFGSLTHTNKGKPSYWSQGVATAAAASGFVNQALVAQLSLWSQLCFTIKDRAQESLSNQKPAQGSMMSDRTRKCRSRRIRPCMWTLSFHFFIDTKYPRNVDWLQNGWDVRRKWSEFSHTSRQTLCGAIYPFPSAGTRGGEGVLDFWHESKKRTRDGTGVRKRCGEDEKDIQRFAFIQKQIM